MYDQDNFCLISFRIIIICLWIVFGYYREKLHESVTLGVFKLSNILV